MFRKNDPEKNRCGKSRNRKHVSKGRKCVDGHDIFWKSIWSDGFKDSLTGQILCKQYVDQETNKLYLSGIEEIGRRGIEIHAIICDGRKGLFQLFGSDLPVQMCQFHQVAIVRRYLTKNPKMQASIELWEHTCASDTNR